MPAEVATAETKPAMLQGPKLVGGEDMASHQNSDQLGTPGPISPILTEDQLRDSASKATKRLQNEGDGEEDPAAEKTREAQAVTKTEGEVVLSPQEYDDLMARKAASELKAKGTKEYSATLRVDGAALAMGLAEAGDLEAALAVLGAVAEVAARFDEIPVVDPLETPTNDGMAEALNTAGEVDSLVASALELSMRLVVSDKAKAVADNLVKSGFFKS